MTDIEKSLKPLEELPADDVQRAEAALVSFMRAAHPGLDVRAGTALRDLLVRPNAILHANASAWVDTLRTDRLIGALGDAEEDARARAILSLFGIDVKEPPRASGQVKISVSRNRVYRVTDGTTLVASDDVEFYVVGDHLASDGEGLQPDGDGRWYFILPVEAAESTPRANLRKGDAISFASGFVDFVEGNAYADFKPYEPATGQSLADRVSAAISRNGMDTRAAVASLVRVNFDPLVRSVNTAGYGDTAQQRDKRNPAGVAQGGTADVYVRTSAAPVVDVLIREGVWNGEGYDIALAASDSPGFSVVRSVSDVSDASPVTGGPLGAAGGYGFSETRRAEGGWNHRMDNPVIDSAYTMYQTAVITTRNVPNTGATRLFKVEVYATPGIVAVQQFIDDRALLGDYLVRGAVPVFVGVKAAVRTKSQDPRLRSRLISAVTDYINQRSFTSRLSMSELTHVMHNNGADSVDVGPNTYSGPGLYGKVRYADGEIVPVQGNTLSIRDIEDPGRLVTTDTCVFMADEADININVVAHL